MNLNDILLAVDYIQHAPGGIALRGQTYLRTYPRILEVAALPGDGQARLLAAASFAYSWMPRILRLDPDHFEGAAEAVPDIVNAGDNWDADLLESLANCLHSVVGAAKVAHFLNPNSFPIWDSNVEGYRLPNNEIDQYHMQNLANYGAYSQEIGQIRAAQGFNDFAQAMVLAVGQRFDALQIPAYEIGPLRLIDLALWEIIANGAQQVAAGDV